MAGGGNSGIIIDITGQADLSFHGVPLRAIKKASFVDKLGTVKSLLKLMVNGMTYDFRKTARNGAVIFGENYGLWDFVAPDGWFDFSGYKDLTVGETLQDMERILAAVPVPAWDSFITWLNANLQNYDLDLSNISSCWIAPIGTTELNENCAQGNLISLDNLVDCVTFIQSVEYAVEPVADKPLSAYTNSDVSFGFMVICCSINEETGEEEVVIPLSFRFRQ